MGYRSLAFAFAALSSAQIATAHAQSVYVAPGGVYVGAGPVYVIPAAPNGAGPYGPAAAPVVVAPTSLNGSNGTQVYIVPAPTNGAPLEAYARNGRVNGAPVAVRRVPVIAPRPSAAVPYNGNGNGRCVVYGRREYCD